MPQDAHKARAEDIERDIPNITSGSDIIEGYWGAAFTWIAYAASASIASIARNMMVWSSTCAH